jgi:hypothetical protein
VKAVLADKDKKAKHLVAYFPHVDGLELLIDKSRLEA